MIDLPARAAWRHQDAPVGFEVLFLHREPDGYGFDGHATAVEGGAAWRAPAACVCAPGLGVERLEESYTHLEESERWLRNEYTAPSFDYRSELVYDEFGLVLEFPGLAVGVA